MSPEGATTVIVSHKGSVPQGSLVSDDCCGSSDPGLLETVVVCSLPLSGDDDSEPLLAEEELSGLSSIANAIGIRTKTLAGIVRAARIIIIPIVTKLVFGSVISKINTRKNVLYPDRIYC